MRAKGVHLSPAQMDQLIGMAWADHCSFEQIEKVLGISEKETIRIMRSQLKQGSFRCWRRRVSGRLTKHRKRFTHREGMEPRDF